MDTAESTMDEKDPVSPDLQSEGKKSKKSKKSKKRKHSSSGSDSDTSQKRMKGKKHKKKCKKKHKHAKDKKHKSVKTSPVNETNSKDEDAIVGPEIPQEILQKAQTMAPMSKEEWEKKQAIITRVFDEATGRTRLIRGEGEVIEEIVTRERHHAINRQATQGDGDFFQSKIKKYI